MNSNDLLPKVPPEDNAYGDMASLQKWLVVSESRLEARNFETTRLARENSWLKVKAAQDEQGNISAKVTNLSRKVAEQSKLIAQLRITISAKEQERYLLDQKLYELLKEGRFEVSVVTAQNSREQAFGSRLQEIGEATNRISALLGGAASGADSIVGVEQHSLDVRVALSHRRAFLSRHLLGGALHRNHRSGLMAKQGYLFIVTYPYSGSSKLIAKINDTPGCKVLDGNISATIGPLEKMHRALETQSRAQALDQQFRSEALGWAMADSFARNVLQAEKSAEIVGATLSYWGADIEALYRQLLFMNSFFPNARFLFLTRKSSELIEFHAKKRNTDWVINRIKYIEKLFRNFAELTPAKCHFQYFNSLDSDRASASLTEFLDAVRTADSSDISRPGGSDV